MKLRKSENWQGKINNDNAVFQKILDIYFGGMQSRISENQNIAKALHCKFNTDKMNDYMKCSNFRTVILGEYAFYLLDLVQNSWFEEIEQ